MTKEQTLTIIQKTNKKANSIDVVETIKNGQNIKEINSLYSSAYGWQYITLFLGKIIGKC